MSRQVPFVVRKNGVRKVIGSITIDDNGEYVSAILTDPHYVLHANCLDIPVTKNFPKSVETEKQETKMEKLPKELPLVDYDENGIRKVIGSAKIFEGKIEGRITDPDYSLPVINLSISFSNEEVDTTFNDQLDEYSDRTEGTFYKGE